MTRYAQARERANAKVAASAGAELDSVPAQGEFEALQRAVKPYEAAQSTGDFDDLSARLRRASSAPRGTGARLTWSQIRSKLNAAGTVPALPIVEQGGDDVFRALQAFQAFSGLPSTGKLTPQTLSYLAAHGDAESRPDVWRARFGGGAPVHFGGVPSGVSSLLASDVPKYVGAGGVALLLANTLGAGLLGSLAAAAGGVALAAWAISHPRSQAA